MIQSPVVVNPETGVSMTVFALHAKVGNLEKEENPGDIQILLAKDDGALDSSNCLVTLVPVPISLNRDTFLNYVLLKNSMGGSLKAGANLKIIGIGTIAFETDTKTVVKLEKVLHCPEISVNLILVSCLDKDRWSVMYGGRRVNFFGPDDKVNFMRALEGDLYTINGWLLHAEAHHALTMCSTDIAVPIEIWHMWFVHYGIDRIKNLVKGNLIDDLNIKNRPSLSGKCEPCIIGNQKHRPFDTIVTPETELLALVALNIWGPACVHSIGGA